MTVFPTASKTPRPVRLSEATREFANDSLNHRYGMDSWKNWAVTMDEVPGFESMDAYDRYDAMIRRIAEAAPIRICDGEKVSGAATLGLAIKHYVPATYQGRQVFESISHLTLDFDKVLTIGFNGIRREVEASLEKQTENDRKRFLVSCLNWIDCLALYRDRVLFALAEKGGYEANIENLKKVPMEPASNYYEGVQSLWFTFAFERLCGNWPGIGRLEPKLEALLQQDLANGTQTVDSAREILAHFFIKGCEWVTGLEGESGDAQHYQNLVLGGTAPDGTEVTGDVTYLALDIVEELSISDYPITVRIHKNSPEKLLRRVAEVMRHGGGIVAVYGEETVLKALDFAGYSKEEALKFANDGCWEVQVPGKTYFRYRPFDSLRLLQKDVLDDYSADVSFDSFDALMEAYKKALYRQAEWIFEDWMQHIEQDDNVAPENWKWKHHFPCTAVSVLEEGCIERGLSYQDGGPVYQVVSPHIGGLPDTANALYAIKKLVFDEKKLGFSEFMKVLKNNWEGEEALRRYMLSHYHFYGNDNDECDAIYVRLNEMFAEACDSLNGRSPLKFPAGVSTFGRQLGWAPERLATPHGHFACEVLSGNCSVTPGSDTEGATAIIRSYCKADLSKMVTGSALDVSLLPSATEGEEGLDALVGLLKGFVNLGGYFMQLDVVDPDILREAQEHPENYPMLSVRVSGWNARFVTMNKEWQDMIIERDSK